MNLLDGPVELLDCDEVNTVVRQGRQVDADMSYVDGLPVSEHPVTTFLAVSTVQPMSGRDLLLMPEGFRTKETLWVWQRYEAGISGGSIMTVADVLVRGGRAYQVQSAEDWGCYVRCMVVEIDLGPYAAFVEPDNLPVMYPAGS